MTFFIKTFGCQMNVNDAEKMRQVLIDKGLAEVDSEEAADIVIINSCAVRAKPEDKVFSYAGRIAKGKKIVVAGCVAQVEKDRVLKKNPAIDFVVGTHQYYRIGDIIDELSREKQQRIKTEFSPDWQELVPAVSARESRFSGFISIMEGCNNFCAYCIVPYTRGEEKYRPFERIVEEAEYLAGQGYKEITLLGQNVNNWQDRQRGMRFPGLLDYLAGHIDVRWLRFITSYPGYYDRELIQVMSRHPRLARHIHFPAQSGSTRILKKMNRSYTRNQYLDIIHDFGRQIPGIRFSSDFIVGFPGETEHDFRMTLSLLEKIRFESVFSFIYSPRPNTSAGQMEDNLDLSMKKERLYRLQAVQERIQLEQNSRLIGQVVEVLVTGKNPRRSGEMLGRTESYQVVNFKANVRPGEIIFILIENVGPYSLRGMEKKDK
jgi:tRNA-2-methylthio-N6-dimethylallyladenosine synthase